ncbi:hypothetical protein NG895_24080 [Aeoliella sp. ICT_H6.2]|uniref:Uncharacterized protein n=1 Tax=Aeoliella straminimaris TaxID=2954799 RepID=A0A9X2JIE5_9BACT|nr:hypothetical protein [Aeoliella straminimaris]MCO6046990.1 hypothetical protein [Aeoliella straminimaris]
MSQPDLTSPGRPVASGQKPKSNVYTGLMGMAAICLAIACILLMMDIGQSAEDYGATSGWFGVVTSAK